MFLALYELTFDETWVERARAITDSMVRWFGDDDTGAFFDTASDAEQLITRPRDATDNAMPSGTSLATEVLFVLGDLSGDQAMLERGRRVLNSLSAAVSEVSDGIWSSARSGRHRSAWRGRGRNRRRPGGSEFQATGA